MGMNERMRRMRKMRRMRRMRRRMSLYESIFKSKDISFSHTLRA
jgi:hypothetical protein